MSLILLQAKSAFRFCYLTLAPTTYLDCILEKPSRSTLFSNHNNVANIPFCKEFQDSFSRRRLLMRCTSLREAEIPVQRPVSGRRLVTSMKCNITGSVGMGPMPNNDLYAWIMVRPTLNSVRNSLKVKLCKLIKTNNNFFNHTFKTELKLTTLWVQARLSDEAQVSSKLCLLSFSELSTKSESEWIIVNTQYRKSRLSQALCQTYPPQKRPFNIQA